MAAELAEDQDRNVDSMTYLGLLIAGFVGMLVFWILAWWLWAATAARGAAPADAAKRTWHDNPSPKAPPAPSPPASAISMQFHRLQSGPLAMLMRHRQGERADENRVRRNCMFVDTVEPDVGPVRIPEGRSDEDGEMERRATGIFFAQADSPTPRDHPTAQDLATQPYRRARPHAPPAVGEARPPVSRRPS